MSSNLLTKYILSPLWIRLIIFTVFYLLILKLHYYEVDYNVAECMNNTPRKPSLPLEQRPASIQHLQSLESKLTHIFERKLEAKDREISNLQAQVKELSTKVDWLEKDLREIRTALLSKASPFVETESQKSFSFKSAASAPSAEPKSTEFSFGHRPFENPADHPTPTNFKPSDLPPNRGYLPREDGYILLRHTEPTVKPAENSDTEL